MQAGGRVGEGSPVREQGWTQQGHQESSLCLPPPQPPGPLAAPNTPQMDCHSLHFSMYTGRASPVLCMEASPASSVAQ